MENLTNCRICNSQEKEFLYRYGAPDKIRVFNYICRDCGVVYQTPRMTCSELAEYYANYSKKIQTYDVTTQRFEKWLLQIAGLRFKFLKKYLQRNQRVIDVGCGPGCLLNLIKKHDSTISYFGINPEESYADYGRKQYGLDIENKMFEEVELSNESFDMIIFDHVFEHINEPRDALKKIHNILKKDGYLFICTNNVLTPHGFLWQNFFLDHPFTYSPNTIARLLNEFDFKIIEIDINGHITYEGYHYPYMTLIAQKKDMVKQKNKGDNFVEVKNRLRAYHRSYQLNNFYHTLTYNLRISVKKIAGKYSAAIIYHLMTKPLPVKFRPKLFDHTLPPEKID